MYVTWMEMLTPVEFEESKKGIAEGDCQMICIFEIAVLLSSFKLAFPERLRVANESFQASSLN